jgi:hypothetical protein
MEGNMPTSLKDAASKTAAVKTPTPPKKPPAKPAVKPAAPVDQETSGLMDLLEGDAPDSATATPADDDDPNTPVPADPSDSGLPKTKAEVTKLSVAQLNALVDAHQLEIPNWAALSVADKKAAMVAQLFPEKASAKQKMLLNDPMSQVQHDIEKMDDPEEIEAEIQKLLASEGMNDFKLGGLLQRLQLTKTFDESSSFKAHVQETYGVAYRKAMYLIKNYNGIMAAGISWGDVEELGWTKLAKIIDVINADNVKEWVAKAKTVNNSTLKKLVQEALAAGGTDLSDAKLQKNFKTKTFSIPEDEVEVIDEAINSAMTSTKTESKGIALSYVCNEFLNSAGDKKASVSAANHKKVVDELEDKRELVLNLTAQLEEAETKLASGGQASLRETFEFLKMQHGGIKGALKALLSDDFDACFPGVELEVDVSKVVDEVEEVKPAKKPAKKKAA